MGKIDYEDLLLELKSIINIKQRLGGAFNNSLEEQDLLLKANEIMNEKMLSLIDEALKKE